MPRATTADDLLTIPLPCRPDGLWPAELAPTGALLVAALHVEVARQLGEGPRDYGVKSAVAARLGSTPQQWGEYLHGVEPSLAVLSRLASSAGLRFTIEAEGVRVEAAGPAAAGAAS